MTTGLCAPPGPGAPGAVARRRANEATRSKTRRLGTCPRLRVGFRRSFTDDTLASGGAYGGGDVGGQECRERRGALLGLANSLGRVGICRRSGTTVREQAGAFVQQGPRRFAPRNEVPQRVEHLER